MAVPGKPGETGHEERLDESGERVDETTGAEHEGRRGGMSVQEAGRKGGERVATERGRGFYESIGRKGGERVASERGRAFYEEIGRKGGEAVRESRGSEFFSEIGHKGGQRVKALIEQAKRNAAIRAARGGTGNDPTSHR